MDDINIIEQRVIMVPKERAAEFEREMLAIPVSYNGSDGEYRLFFTEWSRHEAAQKIEKIIQKILKAA